MRRAFLLASALTAACASAPRPTAASRRIASYPPAVVEGRVTDVDGRPAAGIGVRGIPRGADIPWSAAATTDCDGRFRLSLSAPASYGFLLSWNGESLITSDPRDPAVVGITVAPGQTQTGISLLFLEEEWRTISAGAPPETPSCPRTASPPP